MGIGRFKILGRGVGARRSAAPQNLKLAETHSSNVENIAGFRPALPLKTDRAALEAVAWGEGWEVAGPNN